MQCRTTVASALGFKSYFVLPHIRLIIIADGCYDCYMAVVEVAGGQTTDAFQPAPVAYRLLETGGGRFL